MTRDIIHNNVTIFSRWSRKSYSLFAAIGKVVHIGHLKSDMLISIADIISGLITFTEPQQKSEDDDYDEDVVSENEQISLLIQTSVCNDSSCSSSSLNIISGNSFTRQQKVLEGSFIQFLSHIYYDCFRT